METHVLSAIMTIDTELDEGEDWPVEVRERQLAHVVIVGVTLFYLF